MSTAARSRAGTASPSSSRSRRSVTAARHAGRTALASPAVKSVLFVGAGRHQRRAILQAREQGLRVVAVDRNPDALGLQVADVAEAVDFTDVDAVTEVARRHAVDGALTVSADRAVPVVAEVTERARAAVDRDARRAADAQQDRDAARLRRRRRPAAAVRRRAVARRGPPGTRRRSGCPPSSSRPIPAASAASSGSRAKTTSTATSTPRSPSRRAGVHPRGLRRRHRDERDRDRPRRRGRGRDALGPAATARDRLRRRLDPRLPGVGLRRPAGALGARRRTGRRGARPPRRDRLPAADRPPGRVGRGRRGRGTDPGRTDGRPRASRDRSRPRRRRAPVRARRAGPRRRRPSAIPAAARDSLPDGGAGAPADRPRDAHRQPRACARRPTASSRPTRTSRSARRSARCGSTATAAAT